MDSEPGRRSHIKEPPRGWGDHVVHWLHPVIVVWVSLYDRVVPLLFAVFVAAPIGLVILPFFIPKFIRSHRRRVRYDVHLSEKPVDRIPGRTRTNM